MKQFTFHYNPLIGVQWVGGRCFKTVKAKNITEAKKYIEDYLKGYGTLVSIT